MKKALKTVAFAVGYVVAYLCMLVVLLYIADFFESNFHLRFADLLAFVFGNVLMNGLLIYFRHKTRDSWIRAEAEKWLGERASPPVHPWRRRLGHGVLWIPSGVVLTIFLFFPETAGLVSHLFCGRSVHLNQYRLKTPLTWIVARCNSSSAWVIAGKGIARVGLRPYWRGEEPISEMVFYVTFPSAPNDEFLAHAKVLSQQTLRLGQETLTCRDIVLNADRPLIPVDPRWALILCSSAGNDFHTNFEGQRSEASAFYDALHSVTLNEVKP